MTDDDASTRQSLLAIAWERHRRMGEMCRALRAPLLVLESDAGPLLRYWTLAGQTWSALRRMRPRVLIVQNPSIVLTLLTLLWRPLLRYRFVVDAHNEAVRPHIHDLPFVRLISKWLLRRADLTIVTNEALAEIVAKAGGRPLVLHDRIPEVSGSPPPPLSTQMRVVVISTFASDEPLAEIIAAARRCADMDFFVTGRHERAAPELTARKPDNVHFTGFLPEADYWNLLRSAHLVIDLTKMPDCLVCGAYEAVAVGRPMLLTDIPAARALFEPSACFTVNDEAHIAAALVQMRHSYDKYAHATLSVRTKVMRSWDTRSEVLIERLRPWMTPG